MRKLFFAILLLSAATAKGQTLKGDMNNDKQLDIVDVTALVNVILGYASEEYITSTFAVDNSLVEGTWEATDGSRLTLAGDGSTNYPGAFYFKYLDADPSVIFFYNHNNALYKAVSVKQRTSSSITLVEDGVATVYYLKVYSDEHAYVDLSLPSCTLWATCNVGASSPEQSGSFISWGETAAKSYYGWDNYTWCNGSETSLTKYCTNINYGNNQYTDGQKELLLADDAAYVNWGGEWRMPTKEQIEELFNNTIVSWTTYNGKSGYKIQSKRVSSRYIFMPATGSSSTTGEYWTRTLVDSSPNGAYCGFFSSTVSNVVSDNRYFAASVRPVRPYVSQ